MELFTFTFWCATFYVKNLQVFGQFCPFNFLLGRSQQKAGPNFLLSQQSTKKLKVGGRKDGAQQWKGFNGKVIDFNANFSQTYLFVYFEIFGIVEATYSENMKPICRFNQLCKFEAVYFSAYLFSI